MASASCRHSSRLPLPQLLEHNVNIGLARLVIVPCAHGAADLAPHRAFKRLDLGPPAELKVSSGARLKPPRGKLLVRQELVAGG